MWNHFPRGDSLELLQCCSFLGAVFSPSSRLTTNPGWRTAGKRLKRDALRWLCHCMQTNCSGNAMRCDALMSLCCCCSVLPPSNPFPLIDLAGNSITGSNISIPVHDYVKKPVGGLERDGRIHTPLPSHRSPRSPTGTVPASLFRYADNAPLEDIDCCC